MKSQPAHLRVLPKLVERDGCWEFNGARDSYGYGLVAVVESGVRNTRRTHRVMYEALVGPIPEGLFLDHLCRNPPCCNPAHLDPVTNLENMRRGLFATMTHCRQGHELNEKNTYLANRPGGRTNRQCRKCHSIREGRRQARLRAAHSPEPE